jgi:ring-1,2-phenylacetyl-CoA epoxidase subunit PaaE
MSIKTYHLTIKEVIQETPDTVTIGFWHPIHQAISYKPGQFITIIADINGQKIRRSYSMSSSPSRDASIAVTVKRVANGLMSNWLNDQAKAGNALEVVEPMGRFVVEPNPMKARELVFFGAGSGITPLMSMIKSVLPVEKNSKIYLFYGNRQEESIIFKKQIDQLETQYPDQLKVIHVLSQPSATWVGQTGRIGEGLSVRLMRQLGIDIPKADFYLCGPEGMMNEIRSGLKIFNVPAEQIHSELFHSSPDAPEETEDSDDTLVAQMVQIRYEGKVYDLEVKPHETILEAALDRDIDLPYSCQAGMCTACMARCVEGKVKMDEEDGLTENEIKQGLILTCVAHPMSKGVVIDVE